MNIRESFFNIVSSIKKWFLDMKIAIRFMLLFLLILIFSVISSALMYQQIYLKAMSDKISEVSMQVLLSINSSLESNINILASYSKMILSDNSVQQLLSNSTSTINVIDARRAITQLNTFTEANPIISSIVNLYNFRFFQRFTEGA